MFPFDVILFDVGGVLLTNGWDTHERSIAVEHFRLDLAEFEAKHRAAYGAWERGQISLDTYLDAVVFYHPRDFSRDEFFRFIVSQSQWLPNGAIGILKHVVASNKCMVGALNNEARETNEYRFATFGLREYFKVAFSSCYLGLRKPDLTIYRCAIDVLGGPAERILFIDDRTENVAGAVEAGMTAIRFENDSQLRDEFVRLGLW
jgi:haloacid dehalogenase superfamily, subfamily IA, variant 3 with third motif having DD or ED